MTSSIKKVSVHGGHSGQFCLHARDSLEEVVLAYIAQGFTWVGLTEHMPPPTDANRYLDEEEAGIPAEKLQQQFMAYFTEARRLKEKYADSITLFTCFETEMYDGALPFIEQLKEATRPDYLVGSVHHVGGIGIDYNKDLYSKALDRAGSISNLYCQYFDAQFELLQALKPAVVGHFDLIRIFDDGYRASLALPEVAERITRNLEYIRQQALILDFNLRGYSKSAEPYPCGDILRQAVALGIDIVPGDDSHGTGSVGAWYEEGLKILETYGVNTDWQTPVLISYD